MKQIIKSNLKKIKGGNRFDVLEDGLLENIHSTDWRQIIHHLDDFYDVLDEICGK